MINFSIIVPIYNVEKYLPKCLDSLIGQTYSNIEIICINDGSTDNSLEVLENYEKKDNRIKIINQKNQGVSVARNVGIKSATGNYILFVDADDWINLKTCEIIYNNVSYEQFDLVYFDYYRVNLHCIRPIKVKDIINCCMWQICYKKDFILNNSLLFQENMTIAEDHIFKVAAIFQTNNIKKIDKCLYYYDVSREGSATKNNSILIENNIKAYKILCHMDFYQKLSRNKQLEILNMFSCLLFATWSDFPTTLQKKYNKQLNSFLEYYKNYSSCGYKDLIGYKRLKYKEIWKILKAIRNFIYKFVYKKNKKI